MNLNPINYNLDPLPNFDNDVEQYLERKRQQEEQQRLRAELAALAANPTQTNLSAFAIQNPQLGQQVLQNQGLLGRTAPSQSKLNFQNAQAAQVQQEILQQQRQQEAMQAFRNMHQNASVQDYQELIAQYPELQKEIAPLLQYNNEQEKENVLNRNLQAVHAFRNNKVELAQEKLQEQAKFYEATGRPELAETYQQVGESLQNDPDGMGSLLSLIAVGMDPKKFDETIGKLGKEYRERELQDARKVSEESNAIIQAANATVAQSEAALRVVNAGGDIDAILQSPAIKPEIVKMATLAVKKRNANSVREQQKADLALKEKQQKIENKIKQTTTAADSLLSGFILSIRTIDDLIDPEIYGGGEGPTPFSGGLHDALGGIDGLLPSIYSKTIAADAAIKTLKAQLFLGQIERLKGTGPVTNAEGRKLDISISALSTRMQPKDFVRSLLRIRAELERMSVKTSKHYGLPFQSTPIPQSDFINKHLESEAEIYFNRYK